MLINEIARQTGMTKRAIKFYEEKNLLQVQKGENGYRNYTRQDVQRLKEIAFWRKLGISLEDISKILSGENPEILKDILNKKLEDRQLMESQISALKAYMEKGEFAKADEILDWPTVISAIETLFGREYSQYFINHFRPFLNVPIKTRRQKQALENLVRYCDNTTIKIPKIMKLALKMAGDVKEDTRSARQLISYYRDMSRQEYERLKAGVAKGAKLKCGIMKYHPVYLAQRKLQKELANKGYNDIFIKNMMILSPDYRRYKQALDRVNDKICTQLGIYYDTDYNLIYKNK